MKIALVNESFDPARGGAERCAADLARALEARGHEVTRVERVARGGRIAGAFALAREAERARADHDAVVSLTRAPGDVLIPQGGLHLATVAASLRRHGPAGRVAGALAKLVSPKQWAFLAAERRQYGRRARIVALSRMVRDDMVRFYRVDPRRVAIVPNGVDLERFAPPAPEARAAARARLGLAEDDIAALLVSHNLPLRGIVPLVRALARLPRSWRLLVVGRGPSRSHERLAARLGVRATFAGATDDVRPFYHAADVLAHPTFYDPCSLVTLEALACGLPVVTTRRNGASELLSGHESAVLDDPRDDAALAAALARFEPRAAREAAAREARLTAERHPAAAALDRLCSIIDGAAGEAAGDAEGAAAAQGPRSEAPS